MSITVNTNMQALRIQSNLSSATSKMDTAMERMSSGYKINSAKDDAAGWAVSKKLETTVSSSAIASDNVQIGSNLLDTCEGTLGVLLSNVQRIRDLAEQAANGTYSPDDVDAMKEEAQALEEQIDKMATTSKFNEIELFGDTDPSGAAQSGIQLQVGVESGDTLVLSKEIFADATNSGIGLTAVASGGAGQPQYASIEDAFADSSTANLFLKDCDTAIANLTNRITKIGAASNQLESAETSLGVQQTNLTSALSTIRDADVASESATYVQSQILQSASASLLVQANSAPQIALTLIQGQ